MTEEALGAWSVGHSENPPVGEGSKLEKNWDELRTRNTVSTLLEGARDDLERARLLAVMDKDSGAWLQALPITSVGLRMDNTTLRIAIGLRLGTPICAPHLCQHCGEEVSSLGYHGLSCKHSEGRHSRHAAINDIIHRALVSAGVPSRLEPSGLSRSDGKRPDGMTMVPWSSGRPLVWDATCSDTMAMSYRGLATQSAGSVAGAAEERKVTKYSHLGSSYQFQPIAVETLGSLGPQSRVFVKELGRRIGFKSGERKLLQSIMGN